MGTTPRYTQNNVTFAMDLLRDHIPGLRIEMAGGVAPFQSWGDIGDGYRFYYRDRSGNVSLNVALTGAHITPPNGRLSIYTMGEEDVPAGTRKSLYRATLHQEDSPEQYSRGWVSSFLTLLENLVPLPNEYEFPNLTEGPVAPDLHGWGWTVEEAYEDGLERNKRIAADPFYERLAPILAKAKYRVEDGVMLSAPRTFPETQPVFLTSVPEEWRMSDGTIMVPHEQGRQLG